MPLDVGKKLHMSVQLLETARAGAAKMLGYPFYYTIQSKGLSSSNIAQTFKPVFVQFVYFGKRHKKESLLMALFSQVY